MSILVGGTMLNYHVESPMYLYPHPTIVKNTCVELSYYLSMHADIKPIKFNIKNISGFTRGLNAMLHDIVLLGYLNRTIPLKSFSILTSLLQTLGYYTL